MSTQNTIRSALFLDGWDYEAGSKASLRADGVSVVTTEYMEAMHGNIFCPECCVPLFRSPRVAERDASGRLAYFSHSRRYRSECSFRVRRSEGRRFESEEVATQAITDGQLVIIRSFMAERPELNGGGDREFDREIIEDIDGELTDVAISRHRGDTFTLPTRITTIRGLCSNFNLNLFKYFCFPQKDSAIQLRSALIDINTVRKTDSNPKLYFGVIRNSRNCGRTPRNIRQTMFEYIRNNECTDFCLKVSDALSQDRGINDDSVGRVVLMYGVVTVSGSGLCLEHINWGEFAILPERYEAILQEHT